MNTKEVLSSCWQELYPDAEEQFEQFWQRLQQEKEVNFSSLPQLPNAWFRDGTAYVAYVDHFAKDFTDFTERLPFLQELGVDILWLLPCLASPMVDGGFDISDFEKVRTSLQGQNGDEAFDLFLKRAGELGIRVIFDVTVNHCSDEHPWFKEAAAAKDSHKRNWFFWNDDEERFSKARLLFKGMVDSNWEKSDRTGQYYFHRFYPCQPDLNYQNPEVMEAMISVFANWRKRGVSGFRLDAVPFIWKDEGTDCENRPRAHTIIRFFRAALDYLAPNTLMLAEACQPPKEVVQFFGKGDECHGAYHFPVMPMIYLALARGDGQCIKDVLSPEITPPVPEDCQWFTFLRCHDELTLEMVTPEQRKEIHSHFCHDERWNFRCGEGISSRLFQLCKGNLDQVLLAFSLLFTLPGTPIIYYGDEVAMVNDDEYFEKKSRETGFQDSRLLVRGKIDWIETEKALADSTSKAAQTLQALKEMIKVRKESAPLTRGELHFPENKAFVIKRTLDQEKVVAVHNLTTEKLTVELNEDNEELYNRNAKLEGKTLELAPYGFSWLKLI